MPNSHCQSWLSSSPSEMNPSYVTFECQSNHWQTNPNPTHRVWITSPIWVWFKSDSSPAQHAYLILLEWFASCLLNPSFIDSFTLRPPKALGYPVRLSSWRLFKQAYNLICVVFLTFFIMCFILESTLKKQSNNLVRTKIFDWWLKLDPKVICFGANCLYCWYNRVTAKVVRITAVVLYWYIKAALGRTALLMLLSNRDIFGMVKYSIAGELQDQESRECLRTPSFSHWLHVHEA